MKNLLYSLILLISISIQAKSQNLVSNPSFESYATCPSAQGDFQADDWDVAPNTGVASPDYFNTCASSGSGVGVPSNLPGTQNANDGNAYIGIFCYGNSSTQREYVQTQLSSPLMAGQAYQVSFYVSSAEEFGTAIDNIGALFTSSPAQGGGSIGVINQNPQVTANTMLSSYTDWTLVSGTFQATGGEQYLTIGNFADDGSTTTGTANSSASFPNWGYYYVDMVSVETTTGINDNGLLQLVNLYPNPVSSKLTISLTDQSEIKAVEIFTITGQKIKSFNLKDKQPVVDLSDLSHGTYLLVIEDSQNRKVARKVLKIGDNIDG